MARLKAVCSKAFGQSRASFRTLITRTENMFRLAARKLGNSKTNIDKRRLLTKPVEEGTTSSQTINVPESADVVVIGGGSAGCNALYHLAKYGVNAVLLDQAKLTAGTTWHTAGLIWRLRANDVEMQLLHTTRELLLRLEKETGIDPGWINNGGLYIAHSDIRMDEYKRLATIGKAFNIESHLVSPRETKKIFPLINEDAFHGALYTPGDGVVDPAMLCNALTKYAKNHGAKVFEDCPVTKILTKKTQLGSLQVAGVETPHGTIKTNCVLNAAGVWSRSISKMVGIQIPLIPMKHAYVVSEPVEGAKGLPNIRDHDKSMYFRIQGSSLCMGGYEPNPIILQSVPKDFNFGLYELDWNVFSTHIEAAIEMVPQFSTAGIKTTVCGPESFTPDHKPIMGEDPRCMGFFHSCGYNSAGMMLGGGCGEQIAKWIINERPDKHMYSYDIRRFTPEQTSDSIWANERSHEAYAKNYSIVFPHDESLSGRNVTKDPFHDILLAEGAVMEERQGWERPGWFLPEGTVKIPPYDYYGSYGSPKNEDTKYSEILQKDYTFDFPEHNEVIKNEVLACRNKAALFNLSYFGKFFLCGRQAQEAADYLFTSNMHRENNKTVYTCMLNQQAGVEADCTVTSIEGGTGTVVDPIFKGKGFLIVAGGMSGYQTWVHMNQVVKKKGFHVTLHDATKQIGVLSVQGRFSRNILESVVDEDISNSAFPFSTSKLLTIQGTLVRVIRLSFVGELGFEIQIPSQSCEQVYHAIRQAGKAYDMKLAGYRALYSLSSEKGYHLWHSDLRIDDNPIEAGLGFVCRKTGEYLGKNKIDNIRKHGTKRKMAYFHIADQVPVWGLETIYRDGEVVGYLRRGEYGYALEHSIGQGYVTHPEGENVTKHYLESGSYEIEIMGKKYPAKLYLHSPFDPENKRLHGVYD
ncbi:sarcosine dehydrogenase, mitochondrial [Athalia rosae]|uniref:sarcosine dehydrogenase, mitochondrial n=1 Tax=Athalia rosae TaxID=37344 RepID=UPI002033C627|nr:sarcosine dehydrogenase, mitochondrial [Athalia rosae]XP_012253530.2 sarcosine dehydrogenase, mitochondrial [Athalia rosae]XP_020707260.2 sarcosine dehydrogenase, mitochondrial [Athalia rosae]